jgi:Flp pilus assembly protein TadD
MRIIPLLILAVTLTACDALDAPSASETSASQPISSRERSLIYAADGAAQQGNTAAAERDYRAAMNEGSGHIDAHLGLAQMYLKNGQNDQAIPVLEKALELQPEHAFANYLTGKIYLEQQRYDDAVSMFNRGLTTEPDNLDLAIGKGITEDMRGNHAVAQMNYLRAIKSNPNANLTKVRTNLAMSYLLSGEPKKAVDILKNEGTKANAPSVTRHNLALAYGLLGQHTQAKKLINGEMDEATRQLAIARMQEYTSQKGGGSISPLNATIRDDKSAKASTPSTTKKVAKPAAKSATSPAASKPVPSVNALIEAAQKESSRE